MSEEIPEVLLRQDCDYGALGLKANPFAFGEIVQARDDDPIDSYAGAVVCREAERLWWGVVLSAESPVVQWVSPARQETTRADMLWAAAIIRRLTVDPAAGLLPVYVNPQLMYSDFLRGVANAAGDRLVPREFRRCLFALVRQELQRVVEDGAPAPELEDLAPGEYLDMLRDERLREFSGALFPPAPPAADAAKLQEQLDSMSPEEAAHLLAENQARDEEWGAVKEVRRKLRALVDRLIDQAQLGPAVTAAAHEAMRSGFAATQPFMVSGESDDPHRENLIGMIKLARYAYSKVVFMIDQMDAVVEFTDEERNALIGGLAEMSALVGREALWLLRGGRHMYEMLGFQDRGFVSYRETESVVSDEVRRRGHATREEIGAAALACVACQLPEPEGLFKAGVLDAALDRDDPPTTALRTLGHAVRAAALRGAGRVEAQDLPV